MSTNPLNRSAADACITIDELNRDADRYITDEDLENARSLLEKVDNLLQEEEKKQKPYLHGRVDYLVNLAAVDQYNCAESLQSLLQALQLLDQIAYPQGLIETLNGLSWFYYVLGDFVNAKMYIEQSLEIAEEIKDERRLYKTYNVAGVVLSEIDEVERAVAYLRASIDHLSSKGENKDLGVVYNNLAMVLVEKGDAEEAKKAGLLGLERSRMDHLPLTEACVLDTLGMVYKAKADYPKSIYYFREAIRIFRKYEDEGLDFEPYLYLGEVLMANGELDEAEKNLNTALNLMKRMSGSRLEYACYELFAQLFERRGDYLKAMEYYKEFHLKKEMIYNQKNLQQIANLVSAHNVETALKDAKILELTNAALKREIESQKVQHAELEKLATTDSLTGMMNRRHFNTLSQFEFVYARENDCPLSVIMFDLDHFKNINDQFGHAVGDQALVSVAATINSSIRNEDLACRYGGEEFLLLIPRLDTENALAIAERVRAAIEKNTPCLGNDKITLTVSGGIASLRDSDHSLEELIERADHTLLKAKSLGRNKVLLDPLID